MKKNHLKTCLLSVLIGLSGCVGTFKYTPPADTPIAKQQANYTIGVQSFSDRRPTIGGTGKMWLGYVPLMPYGWGSYNRPEDGKMFIDIARFEFDPSVQLAQAARESLIKSKTFKDTVDNNPDFVLRGNINSTLYEQNALFYGLSVFGSMLWLVGAPEGWVNNKIDLELFLINTKTQKTVWSYKVDYDRSQVLWFYYRGQAVKDYVPVMQDCMNEAILMLQKKIQSNPEILK